MGKNRIKKKSYVRIELPIKIEQAQFDRKVASLPTDQLLEMYSEVYNLINISALEKMTEKIREKEKVTN